MGLLPEVLELTALRGLLGSPNRIGKWLGSAGKERAIRPGSTVDGEAMLEHIRESA